MDTSQQTKVNLRQRLFERTIDEDINAINEINENTMSELMKRLSDAKSFDEVFAEPAKPIEEISEVQEFGEIEEISQMQDISVQEELVETEELMPTETTLSHKRFKDIVVEEGKVTSVKTTKSTKIGILIYLLIAVVLVALIIVNSAGAKVLSSDISKIQNEIAYLQEDTSALNGMLENVSGSEYIENVLSGTDMHKGEIETVKVSKLEKAEDVSIKASSNWFDKICDFFSNLF